MSSQQIHSRLEQNSKGICQRKQRENPFVNWDWVKTRTLYFVWHWEFKKVQGRDTNHTKVEHFVNVHEITQDQKYKPIRFFFLKTGSIQALLMVLCKTSSLLFIMKLAEEPTNWWSTYPKSACVCSSAGCLCCSWKRHRGRRIKKKCVVNLYIYII